MNEQYTTIKKQLERAQESAVDSAQIKKLEDQIRQLRALIKRLEDEKIPLLQRYRLLQN